MEPELLVESLLLMAVKADSMKVSVDLAAVAVQVVGTTTVEAVAEATAAVEQETMVLHVVLLVAAAVRSMVEQTQQTLQEFNLAMGKLLSLRFVSLLL